MKNITGLRCVSCGKVYGPTELDYTCPDCGTRKGTLEVVYDYESAGKEFKEDVGEGTVTDIKRYSSLLPIENLGSLPPLKIGGTPLYGFHELTDDLDRIWIKDDSGNPTASYKDRATALAVAAAREKDIGTITCASTGNAASSLAGLAAASGMETVIFVPAAAPEAKIAQLLVYGANVFAVEGSYDQAYDLCLEAAEKYNWYNRSAAIHPYLVEGKKTGALEMADQLDWNLPDKVFVSVGDGSIVSGLCKGFKELVEIDLIDEAPRVIGVQAEGADTIARAFDRYDGGEVEIADRSASTIADSISVGKPRDIVKAVKYTYENGGRFLTVSDEEISSALVELARKRGIFAEPAAAASYAGLKKALNRGDLGDSEEVGVFITGSGLKDVSAAKKGVKGPTKVSPELSEVESAMEEGTRNAARDNS
ncbi:threonine synthase [Candidatus Bipolaricaulota bacterium]|nr:threonine synthase [Candidatus Bipolaricaulota bacterium]